LIATAAIFLSIWLTIWYAKYDLKRTLTTERLDTIINEINSTPSLPLSFKDTYSKVYPRAFKNSFTLSALNTKQPACECAQLANQIWFGAKTSRIGKHLEYVAFVLTLEDRVSQEKCFEYRATQYDFLYNAIGVHQDALTYFNKPIDSLTIDEQLGLILKLRNAALFNERKRPDFYANGIKELKSKMEE